MAKLKLSSLLADLRGRLGASVISSNASGGYVKQYKRPISRHTPLTSQARHYFSTCSFAWSLLSPLQRDSWRAWAQLPFNARLDWFGDAYFLSSREMFFSVQTLRLMADQVISPDPPQSNIVPALTGARACIYSSSSPLSSFFTAYPDIEVPVPWVHIEVCWVPSLVTTVPRQRLTYSALFPSIDEEPQHISSLINSRYPIRRTASTYFLKIRPLSDEFIAGSEIFLTNQVDTPSFIGL